MSDPIGNIPVENRAIHSQPENVSVLSTKVSETALPIFDSKQPHSLSLDPSRVSPVSVTKFKWCWNFEEEENSLVWTTALEESSIEVAQNLGIPKSTLYGWFQEFKEHGEDSFLGMAT